MTDIKKLAPPPPPVDPDTKAIDDLLQAINDSLTMADLKVKIAPIVAERSSQ